jgi:hypothetical protein
LPYSTSPTFSTSCRVELNYAVFANSGTTSTPTPGVLSSITGYGTNVNPNTITTVDWVYNTTTQTMDTYILQSTYSPIFNTTITYYTSNGNHVYYPFRFDYAAPIALNSPSTGLMTIGLNVGFPNNTYSTTNYNGNLCSINTSMRITSSQASVTNTVGSTTYSSGVGYFL